MFYILAKNSSTFYRCPETLGKAEFKGGTLVNLVKDISREPSLWAVVWILLTAFSQIYSKNKKQMAAKQDLRKFQFDQKNLFKIEG